MSWVVGGILAAAILGLVLTGASQSARYAAENAYRDAEQLARQHALEAGNILGGGLLSARTLGQTMEGMKAAWVDDRSLYSSILKQVLVANTNFVGVWSGWLPDTLDGRDKDFAGKPGQDASGRFLTLWYREGKEPQAIVLPDHSVAGAGDYFQLPLKLGREHASEPFPVKLGKETVPVVSLSVPIRAAGEIVGAAGVLIPVRDLQDLAVGEHSAETDFISIASPSGNTVAHTHSNQVGRPLDTLDLGRTLGDFQAGRVHVESMADAEGRRIHHVDAPIQVGNTGQPWIAGVRVPLSRIEAVRKRELFRGLWIGLAALVVSLGVILVFSRSISRPLGNVTVDLKAAAESLDTATAELKEASRAISEGASSQAASFEETAAALEEMSSMTRRNAENAASATSLAGQARVAVDTGSEDMARMTQAMQEIKTAGDSITKIIRTIDEIAFQTNILALNAAVEAARAGEQGLGFAVVADEVRNLAQRSAAAAKESSLQIVDAIAKSERGVQLSTRVAAGLQEILSKVRQVDELVAQIASASKEQSDGIAQINQAVGRMEQITQANAATTEETTQSISHLTDQARSLQTVVRSLETLVRGTAASAAAGVATPEGTPQAGRPATATARPPAPSPSPAREEHHVILRTPAITAATQTAATPARPQAFPMPETPPAGQAVSAKAPQRLPKGSIDLFEDF